MDSTHQEVMARGRGGGEGAEPRDTENLGFISHSPPFPVELMLVAVGTWSGPRVGPCTAAALSQAVTLHTPGCSVKASSLERSGPHLFPGSPRERPRPPRTGLLRGCDLRYLMRSCPCLFRCICDETFAVHFFFSTHCGLEGVVVQPASGACWRQWTHGHPPASFSFLSFP